MKNFSQCRKCEVFSIIYLKEQNFSDLLWQDLAILVRLGGEIASFDRIYQTLKAEPAPSDKTV
jgi:hypothetical protein